MSETSAYVVPKLSESEAHQASAFRLDSYIMHIQHTSCRCGNFFTSSNFFEVWVMQRGSALSRRLKPCDSFPLPTLPVGKSRLQNKTVPLCWRCVDGVPQPYTEYDTEAAWRDTLLRKATETVAATTEATVEKKKESTPVGLDQL